jgi:hypothetical protein
VKKRLLARLTNPTDTTGQLKNCAPHQELPSPYFWISIYNILP